MSRARAIVTIGIFAAGIGLGIAAQVLTAAAPPASRYQSLPVTEEPAPAAAIVAAIRNDDAKALAGMIDDPDLLKLLGTAISPIVDVSDVKFVGAVDRNGRVLSAYTVTGKTQMGMKVILGFVLTVQNGEVVGVN